MDNPVKAGIYLVMMNNQIEVLKFQIYDEYSESETHEWQYPNNPIDIEKKYDHHPSKWTNLPEITDRWEKEPPLDGQICVVRLVGKKLEDHGLAIAKYKDKSFVFESAYGGWEKDYDDWQFDAWGLVPADFSPSMI
jgi:hypothetical protein